MPRTAPQSPTPAPDSYREAYAALTRIAAELESGEADLDRVLPLIQEAQAAYQVCRVRIEALQAALGEPEPDEELDDEDEE